MCSLEFLEKAKEREEITCSTSKERKEEDEWMKKIADEQAEIHAEFDNIERVVGAMMMFVVVRATVRAQSAVPHDRRHLPQQ